LKFCDAKSLHLLLGSTHPTNALTTIATDIQTLSTAFPIIPLPSASQTGSTEDPPLSGRTVCNTALRPHTSAVTSAVTSSCFPSPRQLFSDDREGHMSRMSGL